MIRKVVNFLTGRMFTIGILMLVQLIFLAYTILILSEYFVYVYIGLITMSLVVVVYIVNRKDNPSYKLAWVIQIMSFPIFGGLFYLAFGGKRLNREIKHVIDKVVKDTEYLCEQNQQILEEVGALDKSVANQSKYIYSYAYAPIYKNTETEYLTPGESFFERLLEALESAKHFIFMEYFIIEEGLMWNSILDIMERKAKEGVEVRVIYDDAGTITTLPENYHKTLQKKGIKTLLFNEVKPALTFKFNNRDHRKITVVDGYIGFMGGINLADEYPRSVPHVLCSAQNRTQTKK
ncbi:MAG: hypothetical protein ATN35_09395 [Epulopiscium sp. Nele67-Bin004]|nr:MAG: hypothetical protein ATN35_09395 [Epulopiscium sp. Nele67-Bin004]